jgi:AcrR family transcriptional regulator
MERPVTLPSNSAATPREGDVRDRIFASALRHFSHKGFAATSLREVSLDAQTTKPMIYYYFGSKEGLYGSIVTEILEEMAETLRAQLPQGATAADTVMAYCERYIEYFIAKEEIIALVLREVFGLGGAPMAAFAQVLGERVRQPLDEVIRRGMESGEFTREHVAPCAHAITGIMHQFILAHVFGGAPIERDAPLAQIRFYLKGLQARD